MNNDVKSNEDSIILRHYYPEPNLMHIMCSGLAKRGHTVTVLTGYPNYPDGVIYAGYGQQFWSTDGLAAVNGDVAELINRARAGIVVKAMNPGQLSRAAKQLYDMPTEEREALGRNGGEYYLQRLSPEVQITKYERLFRHVIEQQEQKSTHN
jgi:hypothetical protein